MTDNSPAAGRDLDLEEGSVVLAELGEAARAINAATARAVLAAGRLVGSGVCEQIEGLPLDLYLANLCRLTGADRGALLTAGDTLRSMPRTAELFADGALSWGQVRRIVGAARRVPVAQRDLLDERILATYHRPGGLDGYAPDDLCDAVDRAADELRYARDVERAEARRERGEFLAFQLALDGWVKVFGQLTPQTSAMLLNALAEAARRYAHLAPDGEAAPTAGHEGHSDGGDGGGHGDGGGGGGEPAEDGGLVPERWTGKDRSRDQARALATLAAAALAGVFATGRPRPAKPLFTTVVDLRQATRTAAGQILLDVPGPLPTVTARLVEQLAGDADLQAVVFEGHRPLAVSRKRTADRIPHDVRTAVLIRDLGSRFPGSQVPAPGCHVHHLRERGEGGSHDVDNLAAVDPAGHLRWTHRFGWRGRYDSETGLVIWTRRDRTLRSLPRGTPLASARGPDDRPSGEASREPPGDPPGDPPDVRPDLGAEAADGGPPDAPDRPEADAPPRAAERPDPDLPF
jgi:hypothetical protein